MVALTPEPFSWLLVTLAVYRLAYLMTIDKGPGFLLLRLRNMIKIVFGPDSSWAEAAECFFCQSVWYAAAGALLLAPPNLIAFLVYWLSIAGACAIFHWAVLGCIAVVNRSS